MSGMVGSVIGKRVYWSNPPQETELPFHTILPGIRESRSPELTPNGYRKDRETIRSVPAFR